MLRNVMMRLLVVLGLAAGLNLQGGTPAYAVPVDLELSIMVDVSISISDTEFNLQRGAYANAFHDPTLHALIASGPRQSIAANFIYWSGATQQIESVPWTKISSAAEADAFGDLIAATSRPFSGTTSIS
jgi:hypothetical protein